MENSTVTKREGGMSLDRLFPTTRMLVCACLFLTTLSSMAQKSDTTKADHHRTWRSHNAYGIPNLTEDQKKKIKALRTPFAKEVMPMHNLLAEKKAHLKTLSSTEKPDMGAINSTIDEISQLQGQLMKKRVAHTQAIRNLLTDEQRIAFDMRANNRRRGISYRKFRGDNRG
jgi:Spy/CpxP family protein refolding chaperone